MASLFFIDQPLGNWIAALVVIAMLPNIAIIFYERGFSKRMAIPHLIPWTLLVGIIMFARPETSGVYNIFLWVLFAVDFIALAFDYPDAFKWWKGQRDVAGRT